jgi:hypothetical protein
MKLLKEKYLENLSSDKKNKSNDNFIKKRKVSLISTLDTQNSGKCLEKSNNISEIIKNYKLIQNSIKEIPSFKGTSLPIFLSSMTNTRNNISLINNKFKLKKGNNSNNNSLINYSSLINSSSINNIKDLDTNITYKNKDIFKKLDLKINFPKLINIYNLKLAPSRNMSKYYLSNSKEDKKVTIQSYKNKNKNISSNTINNINTNHTTSNNKNFLYSMDNNLKKYYLLNKKMNEFIKDSPSDKKLEKVSYKNVSEKFSTINNDDTIKNNNNNQHIKKIKNKNTKKINPKIMKAKIVFETETKNIKKINKDIKSNSLNKEKNDINEHKIIVGFKKNVTPVKKCNNYSKYS